MTAFLDTSVLISLFNSAEPFHDWSLKQFQIWKANGPTIISDIVYCEFSIGMANQADVDAVIVHFGLERVRGNNSALFRAGRAFKEYKLRRGPKVNVLPDFLIGAIAEVAAAPLITTNRKDFIGYFPKLKVISP